MTPDEIAVIKAGHCQMHDVHGQPMKWCAPCDDNWPCLPYRLAVEAERLSGKVARVEALATPRPLVACVTECGFCGSVETCDALNPLRTFVHTDDLRAALADQPEQAQP